MLILVSQNRLLNILGDDVFDFAIALQMFTRSMVIQKRVKDLQLGVESYQKKINITKPKTTRPGIRKMDPYIPHTDLKDSFMLTTKEEIDITKNIQIEYMPQRRWSSLEKKRAHIIIKAIDKQLKKRKKDSILQAGNPVKEILLKLNLPDHRSILTDSKMRIKIEMEGKENGVNILKSIDEGPFQMGMFRDTLAVGEEGTFHLGLERPQVYYGLSPEEKNRYNADIRATNILL
nr:integrase, catalytic region, zinc finger, CCHC-type, peptidase aspartic, catalytic [Tanacetum cinerariifolium]